MHEEMRMGLTAAWLGLSHSEDSSRSQVRFIRDFHPGPSGPPEYSVDERVLVLPAGGPESELGEY